MTGIYIITNLINGKQYIGQSIDIKRRFTDHRTISHETNRHLKNALTKYGTQHFQYDVLEECPPDKLDERERFWIKTIRPAYNVTDGGQGRGKKLSPETIEMLRESGRRSWDEKTDEERNAVIKNNLKGPKVGHAVTDETRAAIREKNTGKKQKQETIEKRKATIAEKKRLGYVQTNSGHKKKVVCIETGEIFESVNAAAEKINVHPSNISSVLNGKQKTAKRFHFKYSEV